MSFHCCLDDDVEPYHPDNFRGKLNCRVDHLGGSILPPKFNAMAVHFSDIMVSNGWVSTLEGDHRSRLRLRTLPLWVPVRPRVCADPI